MDFAKVLSRDTVLGADSEARAVTKRCSKSARYESRDTSESLASRNSSLATRRKTEGC